MALVRTGTDVTNSTIGEHSYFSGRFFINGSLRIDGKFEGKSLQADQLYIGPTGRVKTNIVASNVIAEGIVIGNIVAKNRVLLMATARILGDISTPELIINHGVVLEGRCYIISQEMKNSAKDFIETQYAQDNLSMDRLFSSKTKAS